MFDNPGKSEIEAFLRRIGTVAILGLSETPGRLRTPAPGLGEHTAEILGQFGIDRATLEGLARDGVIGLSG